MKFKIAADSSSNMHRFDGVPYTCVPLKIITKEKEYVDVDGLDLEGMVADLKAYKGTSGTSCPNVYDWMSAFGEAENAFAIAITSNLSGSCNAARQAAEQYMEENPGRKAYVFDSLSAGPELRLIAEKIREGVQAEKAFEEIQAETEAYMKHTHLLFTLRSLNNLARNGRVSPAVAKLAGVQESTGGFSDIEPGAYKLVITKVEPKVAQEYVRIYWDVAEGPRKGAYAQSQYPPSDVLSWKESAFGMLKGKLHRIWQCNPQRLHASNDANGKFLMVDEFEAENFDALVGCRFGAVVRRRLYTAGPNSKTPGADRTAIEVARYLTPDEYRDNDWPESLLQDRDQRDKTQQAPVQQQVAQVPQTFGEVQGLYDEDVPF